LAARRGKRLVSRAEFEDAKDKVMMGAERRTLAMTDEERNSPPIMKAVTPWWR